MALASFANVRLDKAVRLTGLKGGHYHSTLVVRSQAGFERRNANQLDASGSPYVHGRWELGERQCGIAEFEDLLAFFDARGGKAQAFRYRVVGDCSVKDDSGKLVALAGGAFQLYREYPHSFTRKITLPDPEALRIWSGATEIFGFSVSDVTGVVTVPDGVLPTHWTGEYDWRMRFDTDEFQYRLDYDDGVEQYFYVFSLPIESVPEDV